MSEQVRYSMLIEWSDEDQAGLIGHTHGDTYAEAVQKGEEMLRFLVESAEAEGDPIPEPRQFAVSA